jgi:hypothetical protein
LRRMVFFFHVGSSSRAFNREDRKGHAKIAKKIWGMSSGLGIEGTVTGFMWMGSRGCQKLGPAACSPDLLSRRELCVTNVTSKKWKFAKATCVTGFVILVSKKGQVAIPKWAATSTTYR